MSTLLPIIGLVTVAAFTPGPNNFIVMDAAARDGVAGAVRTIVGVVIGMFVLLVLVWAGAAAAFDAEPRLRIGLTIAGATYLAWMGGTRVWRTFRAPSAGDGSAGGLPATFLGIAAFQLMNPKGWVMITTATAAISAIGTGLGTFATLAAMVAMIPITALTVWALAGAAIASWLKSPGARRWFDRVMGGLLVASAGLLLI